MSERHAVMTEREAAPAEAAAARPEAVAGAASPAAPRAEAPGVSGLRKAAILLITLDEDAAAAIFTRLPEDAAERISREIAAMDAVGKEQVRAVVDEFRDLAAAAGAGPGPAPAFEDMLLVDDGEMRRLLADIEPRAVALALKTASPELKEKMLRNMPARAAEDVEDRLRRLGPVRVADVEAAQQAIVDAAGCVESRDSARGGEGDVIG